MEIDILPVESIQERDIDLILLEELTVNNKFCDWFTSEIGAPKFKRLNCVCKSISDFNLGETDLLFSYMSIDNKKIFILIENKIDASFQSQQFERYVQRGKKYMQEKKCDIAIVTLVAPQLYCENQNVFENFITFEAIGNRFRSEGSKRHLFKSQLFTIASEKLRRGYKPVNSIPVQKFWLSYWKLKEELYPDLIMKKPNIVPANSDWPILYDKNLKGISFYHKLSQGNVDATFKGFSEEIERRIKDNLPENAQFVKHNKTFSIRYFAGKCDRMKDFESQKETVIKGLELIDYLRKWLIRNKQIWNSSD